MDKRTLGNTGDELSLIGFGGIAVRDVTPREADRYVGRAIDRGINYFDVAPSYGNAEERLGPALRPHRDRVFLACKTTQRSADGAASDLEQSLKTLETDHFDLYQCHGVPSVEDAERILAPGGALEALVAARDRGLIRHIGFSAHSEEAALLLLDAFPFASVLLPINLFCWQDGGFGPQVCEVAQAKGTGILALKSLAKRPWRDGEREMWPKCWYRPVDTVPEAMVALAFTLSLPVTAAVCPGHVELLWVACDALERLGPPPWKLPPDASLDGEPIFHAAT
ncbi:MAG: aldo/keto reductase [Lentisphaeria bacterium]|nr:aldo/keto reductase [Lentisphaeria bacterium]